METEILRDFVAENRELEEQLTKKNAQYIFDLKKSLQTTNLSEAEQAQALHDVLPQLVAGQKSGKTARQIFGTVSERTQAIVNKPKPTPKPTPILMWLDNVLLLMGALALMLGLMEFLSKGTAQSMGITTLVSASMVGGYVLYLMYKYVYQYDRPGADKSKRPSWLKSIGILLGSVLLWFIVFTAVSFLPAAVNPILDPVVIVGIGTAALVSRYLLKKRYNLQSSFNART